MRTPSNKLLSLHCTHSIVTLQKQLLNQVDFNSKTRATLQDEDYALQHMEFYDQKAQTAAYFWHHNSFAHFWRSAKNLTAPYSDAIMSDLKKRIEYVQELLMPTMLPPVLSECGRLTLMSVSGVSTQRMS